MATVKLKFRASSLMEKEGSLYYLIIQGRSSRQIAAGYKIAHDEWDSVAGEIRLQKEDDRRRRTLAGIQKVNTRIKDSIIPA